MRHGSDGTDLLDKGRVREGAGELYERNETAFQHVVVERDDALRVLGLRGCCFRLGLRRSRWCRFGLRVGGLAIGIGSRAASSVETARLLSGDVLETSGSSFEPSLQ